MKAFEAILCVSVGVTGCATTGASGPGYLDATLIREAVSLPGEKFEIRTDGDGVVKKIALTHHAAGRLPKSVQKLLDEKLPGATIKKYELEAHEGEPMGYEVEVESADKRECELSTHADGSLRYMECEMKPEELPTPIGQWLKDHIPNGQLTEVESVRGVDVDEVAVELKVGELLHSLHFKVSGELLRHSLIVNATVEVPVP